MGLSSQQILAAAPVERVVAALRRLPGIDEGYAVPLRTETTAVILNEHAHGWDLDPIAARLSDELDADTMTAAVIDSDVCVINVFRSGEPAHEYVSHPDYGREIQPDADGVLRFLDDGSVFDPEAAGTPPAGAEPAWFLPFGGPEATAEAVAVALGDGTGDPTAAAARRHVFAEHIYCDLLDALGLPARVATVPWPIFVALAEDSAGSVPEGDQHAGLPATYLAMLKAQREERAALRIEYASSVPLGGSPPITAPIRTEGIV